jgi:hypothetical protein
MLVIIKQEGKVQFFIPNSITMSQEITSFEAIRRTNPAGNEFRSSRDFAKVRVTRRSHQNSTDFLHTNFKAT